LDKFPDPDNFYHFRQAALDATEGLISPTNVVQVCGSITTNRLGHIAPGPEFWNFSTPSAV
jgi:hypothetical protein